MRALITHYSNILNSHKRASSCPTVKVKVFSYSLPSIWPGADPGVQAVSPRDFKAILSGRLILISTRPAVTFPAEERHCPSTSTKLYCMVTEAHTCKQLAQGCYAALPQ